MHTILKQKIYVYIYPCSHDDPNSGNCSWIPSAVGKIGLDDSFVPLIVPSIAAPVTFFYMKQYMESNLPLELVEAARIGRFR